LIIIDLFVNFKLSFSESILLFVFSFCCLEELYDACVKGDLEKVKSVLSENSSLLNEGLNEHGNTALCLASDYTHSSIVSFLLEQENIDVNKTNKVNHRF
jgi:ankyrin repeat protein